MMTTGDTDAHGNTLLLMSKRALDIAAATVHAAGWGLSLGRLWTGPRRWLWVDRFQPDAAAERLSDGSRFEPVEHFATKRA